MRTTLLAVALLAVIALLGAGAAPAEDAQIRFGTDGDEWALNGVCDDRRFDGVATAMTRSWDAVGRDAQDCRDAVTAGTAHLWTLADGLARSSAIVIDFGDNASEYAYDNVCDDPRFEGHGASERHGAENIGHDSDDCRRLWQFGSLFLRDMAAGELPPPEPADPFYGDNSGPYSADGECDDRRFVGGAMATSLSWAATGKDAADCRMLAESGAISVLDRDAAMARTNCAAIDWGNDSSGYANDGSCDDYRFDGLGAAFRILADEIGKDATDCRRMCDYGLLFIRETTQ